MIEVSIKRKIESLIQSGATDEALVELNRIARQVAYSSDAGYLISQYQAISVSFPLRKLAVLRSYTLEPLIPFIRCYGYSFGISFDIQLGGYNTFYQELTTDDAFLVKMAPDIVLIALSASDVLPRHWFEFTQSRCEDLDRESERLLTDLRSALETFRRKSDATILIHNFDIPVYAQQGVLDVRSAGGQIERIARLNQRLQELCSLYPGCYVFDYQGLVANNGRFRWYDEYKWATMRMPLAAHSIPLLAMEHFHYFLPIMGKTCKALAIDLDNTLWGGVIGEDGLEGIQLGIEYPGVAFRRLQQAILDLFHRGIILAICSKNNREDAIQVFKEHPYMILKMEHFAAMRINWQDKAANLRELAKEINIGLDSMAFLDDNPYERDLIRQELPSVMVFDLPDQPMEYSNCLRSQPFFQKLNVSKEDRERGRYYAEQRQRIEWMESASDMESFLKSLDMEVAIKPVNALTLQRVAQLTQKTNQFNLTTRRYSEQQISEMMNRDDYEIITLSLYDRFGDNGLVGVAIIQYFMDKAIIDTFLLSCRVIGRKAETALLAYIIEQAVKKGKESVEGWYLRTAKNEPARDFYPQHEFSAVEKNANNIRWQLDIRMNSVPYPDVFKYNLSGS